MTADSTQPEAIRTMFARVARRYDLNNRLHSFGMDRLWRRRAVREAGPCEGRTVLDAACGTGDMAIRFARAGAGRVVGLDFCWEMLQIARRKARRPPLDAIEWVLGDATALPFGPGAFDVVSIAFGLRNIPDRASALRGFLRALRPGGRLVVLEFHRPRGAFPGALARFYMDRVMPRSAAWVAGDRNGAYDYLRESVKSFASAQELDECIRAAGFADVRGRSLMPPVAAVHLGTRP